MLKKWWRMWTKRREWNCHHPGEFDVTALTRAVKRINPCPIDVWKRPFLQNMRARAKATSHATARTRVYARSEMVMSGEFRLHMGVKIFANFWRNKLDQSLHYKCDASEGNLSGEENPFKRKWETVTDKHLGRKYAYEAKLFKNTKSETIDVIGSVLAGDANE